MSSTDNPRTSSLAVRFLQRFLQDRAAGTVRSLDEYQQMFPAGRDIIAAEYEAVMAEAPEPNDDGSLSYPAQGDRYREEATIGRGGMGTVVRVFDPSLERVVAMKRLTDADGKLPDAQRLGRFLDEAKVTGRLHHPGIVAVLEIGLDAEQRPYFTMPLIEGRSLQELIKAMQDGDPTWTQMRLLEVLARVCEAVAYAHERGVIHRDLKPANVMIGSFGETYVVDWGLARDLDRPDRRDIRVDTVASEEPGSALRTMEGDVIGTPAYMAPEQARGETDSVDRRSDVYSLGAMLYHVLTGNAPYVESGTEQSSRETLEHVLAGPPRSVTQVAPETRPELAAICERAMAQDPDHRYPSALDLGSDVRAFLENRVVRAYAQGPLAELSKWMRRNRALTFTCLAGVLALALALAWSEVNRHTADDNASLANENLGLAFEAGDELLGAFGFDDLTNSPGSDPVRTAVLERALAYYERLRDLRGDDPRVDRHAAKAQFRITRLKMQLGRVAEARASWATAKRATEAALARHGETAALRLQLIKIEAQEPILTLQTGSVKAAVPGLEKAFTAISEFRKAHPRSAEATRTQLTFATHLAIAMINLRNRDGAIKYSDASVAASRAMIANEPDSASAQALHGSVLTQRGKLMWQLGNIDKANERYDEAEQVFADALQKHPAHRGLRAWFGDLHNLRGAMRMQGGDQDGAEKCFERAREIYEPLVTTHPGVRNFHGQLGGILCNLGLIQSMRHNTTVALERLNASLEQLDLCLDIDAKAVDYLRYFNFACEETAMVHLAEGRHVEAAAIVRKWMGRNLEGNRYAAGRLFARCADRCEEDQEIADNRRAVLTRQYGDEAMALLLAAHERKRVKLDSLEGRSFNAIRNRDDFKALVAELSR